MTSSTIGSRPLSCKRPRPSPADQLSFPERVARPEARGGARASLSLSSFPPATPSPAVLAAGGGSRYDSKHVSGERLSRDDEIQRDRRREREGLRDVLNRVSTLKRCQDCGWVKKRGKKRQPAEIAARDGRAYWRKVQRCASIHTCRCAGARSAVAAHSLEISQAAATWIDAGNEVYMITFTSPHDLGMALAALLTLISAAFRSVISGRAWLRLKDELGIVGTIRSLEVTHGPSGWHPHLHVLVFVRGRLDARGAWLSSIAISRASSSAAMRFPAAGAGSSRCGCRDCGKKKIRSVLARDPCVCGGPAYKSPSYEHGVQIERCYSGGGAAEYICKTELTKRSPGNELARGDMKTARGEHRVPFEILASAGEGNEADLRLWREYEHATDGHQCITWSKGLREIIQESVPGRVQDEDWLAELTDEELADLEVNGGPVALVDPEAMDQARGIPGFRVSILEAYEDQGLGGLLAFVEANGFEAAWGLLGTVPLIVPAAGPGEDNDAGKSGRTMVREGHAMSKRNGRGAKARRRQVRQDRAEWPLSCPPTWRAMRRTSSTSCRRQRPR